MPSRLPKVAILFLLLQHSRAFHGEHLDARHAHNAMPMVARAEPTIPPLSSISLGMSTHPAPTFTVSFPAGTKPSISGAPPLPTALSRVGWPPEDKVPDTNSPQVKAWMKELEGVDIPDIPPTKDGTCAGDPAAAAQAASRGWWTCGGYTRSTDIVACPTKLDWGLTFDDGPSPYTPILLKKLQANNLKASFYVIGSRVIERPNILIDEYMTGHEIGLHTWSHPSLTSLTNEQIVAEFGWTRKAIKAVLGVTPTTMRPPKGDIDDRVRAISLAMGMVPVLWTSTPDGGKFDSFDWRVAGGQVTGPQSFEVYQQIMKNATNINTGFITLQHDLFEITVDLAVGYTLDAALKHVPKFSLQPVGQCLKLNATNLYRETTTNTTFPYKTGSLGGRVDVDGDGKIDAAIAIGIPKGSPLIALAAVVLAGLFL
jgi:peptidoglycan/xylan/chitin deacetylase (PgdA/CDA1 family)